MNHLNPNYFHVFRFWTFSLSRQERPVASPCPSVRIYRCGSHWKDFHEICYWRLCENMSRQCRFGYILTKISVCLHDDLSVFHILGSDLCRPTIQLSNCCASIATLSVCITLFTATFVFEQYKGNASLRFRGNSVYANAP
jgi:hypothetical protein